MAKVVILSNTDGYYALAKKSLNSLRKDNILKDEGAAYLVTEGCLWAVSYTHLDVYKRQMEISYSVSLPEFDGIIHGTPVTTNERDENGLSLIHI